MSAEEHKDVVRRYFEDYHNGRRTEALAGLAPEETRAAVEAARAALARAFPDYRLEIRAQVAEGDLVATVWGAVGTHEGDWDSPVGTIAPTGRRVEWSGTTTLRLDGGLIVDTVGSNWDHLGILQQLGVVEAASPRPGA